MMAQPSPPMTPTESEKLKDSMTKVVQDAPAVDTTPLAATQQSSQPSATQQQQKPQQPAINGGNQGHVTAVAGLDKLAGTKPATLTVPSTTTKTADKRLSAQSTQSTASKGSTSSSKKAESPGSFAPPATTRAKLGWTAFSNLPNPGQDMLIDALRKASLTEEQLAQIYSGTRYDDYVPDHSFLAAKLSDKYYGKWFHNGAAMLLGVFFTYVLTRLGAGLFGCIIIGAFLATYYQTSTRRLRQSVRDDMQRELSLRQLETDNETVNWMNYFVGRFWLIIEPYVCEQVVANADKVLSENCPSFLDSLRLSTFTLGTKSPRFEFVKSYPNTDPNIVCMDWKVSFTPSDLEDLSGRDIQSHVDPKIVLTIRVGKGMVGTGMPVLLEKMAFVGHLRFRIKLFNEYPFVKTLDMCFLEEPYFDYVLKPVGGDTFGFDINNIPGLQTFVRDQVHANLGPMMYAPNVFSLDIASLVTAADSSTANGVLALTIHSAQGLKTSDLLGSLDPYITAHLGNENNEVLARTKCFENNKNPVFNETLLILINKTTDTLYLNVKDRNTGRKDGEIGVAKFDLSELAENENVIDGATLPVMHAGKTHGQIKCEMHYFPVSMPSEVDGQTVPAAESDTGILRFTVYECSNLCGGRKVDAYAEIEMTGEPMQKTNTYKRNTNPRWDKSCECFVGDMQKTSIKVTIKDDGMLTGSTVLGTWRMTVADLEAALAKQIEWFPLDGQGGKIHVDMKWKPVVMTGFAGSLSRGVYAEPIGVVRVHMIDAKGLKNSDALTGGKSDPYVRVVSGVQTRAQTDFELDNLDPAWDTILYVPVHSIREDLVFEVMDYNESSNDKTLGIADFKLKDIVEESTVEDTKQKVYKARDPLDRTVDLCNNQRKPGKGKMHYKVTFHPTLALAKAHVEEVTDENEEKGDTKKKKEADAANAGDAAANAALKDLASRPGTDIHGEPLKYIDDESPVLDLPSYGAGILSVTIHEATIPGYTGRGVAELFVDSNDPQYRTIPQDGPNFVFNETADAFIKELDFSNVVVRLSKANQKKPEDVSRHWTLPASKILQIIMEQQQKKAKEANADKNVEQDADKDAEKDTETAASAKEDEALAINAPSTRKDKKEGDNGKDDENSMEFKILDTNGGTIRLSFAFTPVVDYTLRPEESMENQGNLTVTPISATHLRSADRNGKSDPYVVFMLDGKKMFKTETYKKTLNPKFNAKKETFVMPVRRRIGAKLEAIIFDWDQVGSDEELARVMVPFTADTLESFTAREVELPLSEDGKSLLKLRLLWQPQLLARAKQGTSLLGTATRTFTAVPGQALGAGVSLAGDAVGLGGKVLGTGGKAIGSGGKAIVGGVGRVGGGIVGLGSRLGRSGTTRSNATNQNTLAVPDNTSARPESVYSTVSTVRPGEAARVTIVGARALKDDQHDVYLRATKKNRSVYKTKLAKKTDAPEWNENFQTNVDPAANLPLEFKMYSSRHVLSDIEIGSVSVDLSKTFQGWLALEPPGSGEICIQVEAPETLQQ
ncbi:C2 domain-containing protein [Gongronella butleri]|nr:C2 domain-containing protein [Gongronella butleri]